MSDSDDLENEDLDGDLEAEFRSLFSESLGSGKRDSPGQLGSGTREPQNEAFQNMLDKLSSEGSRSESGAFTLNPQEAEKKLGRFSLEDPNESVVHLLAAAVSCGATYARVTTGASGFSFHFDGKPFQKSQLQALLPSLLSHDSPSAIRELAMALNTLLGQGPRLLLYESWHQGTGFRLQLGGDRQVENLTQSPWEAGQTGHRITFELPTKITDLGRAMGGMLKGSPQEAALAQRCAFAPIPIYCGQKDLRSFPSDTILSYLLWEHPDHLLDVKLLPKGLGLHEASPGPFSMLLAIGPEPYISCNVNGICYRPPWAFQTEGIWCLITDNQAKRDLGFAKIQDSDLWFTLEGYFGIGIRKLVQFTEERHTQASHPERRESLAGALRLVPSTLKDSTNDSQPIYQTTDGRWMTLSQLRSQARLLYTEQKWDFPLRSGTPVFVLSPQERKPLEVQARLADKQLASSQIYFQKLNLWKQQTPTEPSGPAKSPGPVHKLKGASGRIGLQTKPHQVGKLYPYIGGRALGEFDCSSIPPGCWISLEHEEFSVNDTWTDVDPGVGVLKLLDSIALSALVEYYLELLEDSPKYNLYLLEYLIDLKRAGRPWYQLLPKIAFNKAGFAGMFGAYVPVTLGEQYKERGSMARLTTIGEVVKQKQMAQLLPKLLMGLSVSRAELSLLQKLCS